jgi:hypothetical protein
VAVNQDDLAAMVEEELDQAQALSWDELKRVTPWGDSYTGLTPAGEEVEVERNYLWSEDGAAIQIEVSVRRPGDRSPGAFGKVTARPVDDA